jgi:hypothetical protein
MALKFQGTLNAFNRDIEKTKPKAAVDMIEDWEAAVSDLDMPGAKGIARDLASLRKQLEKGEPDGERIRALLGRLGEATTKIAGKAEKNGEKLTQLGEALSDAGEDQPDEEEDTEAAAKPHRRKKAA